MSTEVMVRPISFLLTINNLRVRCGRKWYGVVKTGKSWEREADKEEPVGNRPKSTENSPNRQRLTELCAVFTSLAVVAVHIGFRNVSRQSPNSRRRKGTPQGPRRIQAGHRREGRTPILHHQSRWQGCSSVSLRGVGADRAEAGRALHFQSYEEEVSGPGELLRADGGNGWPGAAADAATVARSGADQRRGCGHRQLDALDRAQPGFVSQVGRGRQVHA